VKIDVIDTSPNFAARFSKMEARAHTSASVRPASLADPDPLLRRIDEVGLNTLEDCMQTVFEDGPRRDRRLWVGDLRLQALTNYVTFRNTALVKRCLYLFGGLLREDGLVAACVYDDPTPLCGRQYIMDYSALYAAAVLDYVKATRDFKAARDLWTVVRRQMEIPGKFVNSDGRLQQPAVAFLEYKRCPAIPSHAEPPVFARSHPGECGRGFPARHRHAVWPTGSGSGRTSPGN
jgi:hypothetical protein